MSYEGKLSIEEPKALVALFASVQRTVLQTSWKSFFHVSFSFVTLCARMESATQKMAVMGLALD